MRRKRSLSIDLEALVSYLNDDTECDASEKKNSHTFLAEKPTLGGEKVLKLHIESLQTALAKPHQHAHQSSTPSCALLSLYIELVSD